ncbi:MAG: alpha/beta hydrolase, partial [Frankiales bacterium]|nr:alpha/beta hydrolase [Frankiales bacterium]
AGNPLSSSGPRLRGPDLLASLSCAGDVAGSPLTPVLLLHGTGSTPQETWGPVYLPQLAAQGRPACTVQLPNRATGDMQVSSEVVVAAIREVSRRRGGRISVVGHSQGATLAVTALKFWPDLPGLVEDYIGLAPTLQPGISGDAQCLRPCSAPFQQRSASSVYFAAVLAHPLPAGPSYTTIATRYDEIAAPAPQASRLDGAANVVVQDPCPGKIVEHFGLVTDGTVFSLVLDGLTHPGPVDTSRLPVADCLLALPAGSDPATVAPLVVEAVTNDLAANAASEKLSEEPPVRCYVRADCADVVDRGRILTAATLLPQGVRLTAQAPGTVRVHLRGGRTLTATVPVGTRLLRLPLSPGAVVTLQTTTSHYRVSASEWTLQVPKH